MTDTVLPRQVRDQIALAQQIGQAMQAEQNPPAPAPEPGQASAPTPAPAPAAPVPAPAPAPVTDTATDKDGTSGDAVFWRNNYLAMKGRLDSHQDSSRQAVADLTARVTELTSEIAKLKTTPPAPVAAPPSAPFMEEARGRFGDGVVDLVQTGAKAAVLPEVQAMLDAHLKPLKDQLAQQGQVAQHAAAQVAATEEDRFFAALDATRPDWERVNAQQGWIQFMGERDPFSGVERQLLVNDAIAKRDVRRLVAIIDAYAGPYQSPTAPGTNTPAAPAAPNAPDLSPAPRTVGSTVVQTTRDDTAPLVTRQEIAVFYQDVAAGRYRNRPTEKQAFESKIAEATRTGRIN